MGKMLVNITKIRKHKETLMLSLYVILILLMCVRFYNHEKCVGTGNPEKSEIHLNLHPLSNVFFKQILISDCSPSDDYAFNQFRISLE